MRLAGGVGHGRLAEIGVARRPLFPRGLLAHLRDVFFGFLEPLADLLLLIGES